MFFTECARLAEQHPDLATVFEQLDSQLGAMGTAEVIRSDDLASFLNIDPNQIRSALDMFAEEEVLLRVEMIECKYVRWQRFGRNTRKRCGEKWQEVSIPRDGSGDTDLHDQTGVGVTPRTTLKVPRTMGSDTAVEALLALKGKKGWTMEELARGLTLQGFKKRRAVRSSVFRTMANRLGISPEDLLGGNIPGIR